MATDRTIHPAPTRPARPNARSGGTRALAQRGAILDGQSVKTTEKGARSVPTPIRKRFARLKTIWADGGYAGELAAWARRIGK